MYAYVRFEQTSWFHKPNEYVWKLCNNFPNLKYFSLQYFVREMHYTFQMGNLIV